MMKAVENHVAGDPLGTHRVLQPSGAMPQMAWKLDNDASRYFSNEIVVDVEALSIDAASFRQIEAASGGDEEAIVRAITRTVASRGKQHNPVTGSGGVLMGKVSAVGAAAQQAPKIGERLVSLASLTGTPLRLDAVKKVHRAAGQLEIKGQAVIFESYPYARVPKEMAPRLALAVFSICAAPALATKLVSPGQNVLIFGAGGKSGVLCAYAVRERIGREARLIGVDISESAAAQLRTLDLCDEVIVGDGADALTGRELAASVGMQTPFDVTLSCVNAGEVEMSAILATRPGGQVCFFSSQTSFTRAVYSAQAASKDLDLRMGGAYVEGQADLALRIVQQCPAIRNLFTERYL